MNNFEKLDLLATAMTNFTNVCEAIEKTARLEGQSILNRSECDIHGDGYLLLSGASAIVRGIWETIPQSVRDLFDENVDGAMRQMFPHLWQPTVPEGCGESNLMNMKKAAEYGYLLHSEAHRVLQDAYRMKKLFNE
jgi:hypothetical protein